jgi:hypothetical protein
VTGASGGIGAATALAAQGAVVALLARRADRLQELKTEIESAGGSALVAPVDVTDAEEVSAAVARSVAEFGRLDTVVNNAGLIRMGSAADAPLPDWDDLVTISSTAGWVARPGTAVYPLPNSVSTPSARAFAKRYPGSGSGWAWSVPEPSTPRSSPIWPHRLGRRSSNRPPTW